MSPVTKKKNKILNPIEDLKSASDGLVVSDLLARADQATRLLEQIAKREQVSNPNAAIRAATQAARLASDTASNLVLRQRLDDLTARVDEGLIDRQDAVRMHHLPYANQPDLIGNDANGEEVLRPTWGRPSNASAPSPAQKSDPEGDQT